MTDKQITGRIIKGISGFYYVHDGEERLFECRARGVFRNRNLKPLVGDLAVIDVIDEENLKGNLVEILPREKELFRPAVANVDQAVMIFAVRDPDPNYILLDKFLITMNNLGLPVILCFNKIDVARDGQIDKLRSTYEDSCKVCFISIKEKQGLHDFYKLLEGKTSVLAGPSGSGKSSFLNYFCPEASMETGSISKKLGRGRHTTRHAELFAAGKNTYICDTPGFTSLELRGIEAEQLRFHYPEFEAYEGSCRFQGCVHVAEPGCSVKAKVKEGMIAKDRYDSYCYIYKELAQIKKY